jgi:hypothetical protein
MTLSTLRPDLVDQDLIVSQEKIKIIAETQFVRIVASAIPPTRTPQPAKNIIEVMELIEKAIRDYDERTHVTEDAAITLLYDSPDTEEQLEAISISLERREPGMHGQGRPFENAVKQLKPILREEMDDPDHPGYKRAILGKFYDNMLQLTCWARTNKQANERALWLENVMEEYDWFFVASGTNRVLYQGRASEKKTNVSGHKAYGRPINYFVRTEKLTTVSQKELEQVQVRLAKMA